MYLLLMSLQDQVILIREAMLLLMMLPRGRTQPPNGYVSQKDEG